MMREDIPLKTADEVARLRAAAAALERVMQRLKGVLTPGTTTFEVEHVAVEMMRRASLAPALSGFGGYPAAICTSVNSCAAHGLPASTALGAGDLVTIDISADLGGYKADLAWTFLLPPISPAMRRVARAAWAVTMAGVQAARAAGRLGDVGLAIANAAGRLGCSVIPTFTGHGIGRELHEPPLVANEGTAHSGVPIVPGMVLNIEPVVCLGAPEVRLDSDGWSYVTCDGSLAAQYELTVAIRSDHTEILTFSEREEPPRPQAPPYW